MAQPIPLEPNPASDKPGSSNLVASLLDRVRDLDPTLAEDLAAAVKNITADREFGLVFNRHMPETVELPGRVVRKGDKVRIVGDRSETVWKVVRTRRGDGRRMADLVRLSGDGDAREAHVADLVVVADFRDDIYPGLTSTGKIERGGDKPAHVVINGENYHALDALTFTHAGKVDCIYIDPPYNTGGDLTYNDKRVSREDGDKHAKWLSFMERRLKLAKKLLKPTGVIIAAIDDNEQAHLKLLMDQIFGEQNFIANVVWQGARKNDAFFVSNGHDYMLVYGKSKDSIRATDMKWREEKVGVHAVLEQGRKAWEAASGDDIAATAAMRAWFKSLPKESELQAMSRCVYFLPDGRLCRDCDITWPGGGGPRYDVLHPKTQRAVPVPDAGWRFSNSETMQQAIHDGRVIFRDDHTKPISLKKPLENTTGQVVLSTFDRNRMHAGKNLEKLLGEKRFDFPKDVEILKRWIGLVTTNNPEAVILDFFAGSGSTGQAVMELNAADDGRRQCILITNNEVNEKTEKELIKRGLRRGLPDWEAQGIHQRVTRPRLETVATGIRPDGSKFSDGLEENVEFFDLTYENPDAVKLNMAFSTIAPLLWLRAGGQGSRIDTPTQDFAVADHYAVLFNPDRVKPFLTAVKKINQLRSVFIVTDDDTLFQRVSALVPDEVDGHRVDVVRLYENYLTNFKNNAGWM